MIPSSTVGRSRPFGSVLRLCVSTLAVLMGHVQSCSATPPGRSEAQYLVHHGSDRPQQRHGRGAELIAIVSLVSRERSRYCGMSIPRCTKDSNASHAETWPLKPVQ